MRLLIIARNRTVAVEEGQLCPPEGRFDLVLRCPDAEVRPGLINAHDHLHRNHYGRLGRPPYRNAYHWARDIQRRHRRRIAGRRASIARRDALLAGAWKNLFAGVTSVVHHDPWEASFEHGFPLRVVRVASADSLGMNEDLAERKGDADRFGLHVAEGVDTAAAEEVRSLDAMGLLDRRLLAVHGVGVDEDGVARLSKAGAALIWCPTSNLFLFGRTAPPALFSAGIDVLIGSDSLLTGAGDLLDELRAARSLGRLGDVGLEAAVGPVAARRLGLAAPSLEPGARADLILVTAPLLEAQARHVVLVVADGIPRVASAEVARQFGSYADRGRRLSLRRVTRWTSALGSTASRISP